MIKIELKGIKYAAFASEETSCYSATLYVDGVKWGEVSNEGHGGPDNFHGVAGKSWTDIKALDERLKVENPKIENPFSPAEPFDASLELICGDLLDEYLRERDVKKALSSKLCFLKPGKPGVFTVPLKQKGRVWTVEQVKAAWLKREPDMTVINGLPLPQAVALFREHGAA